MGCVEASYVCSTPAMRGWLGSIRREHGPLSRGRSLVECQQIRSVMCKVARYCLAKSSEIFYISKVSEEQHSQATHRTSSYYWGKNEKDAQFGERMTKSQIKPFSPQPLGWHAIARRGPCWHLPAGSAAHQPRSKRRAPHRDSWPGDWSIPQSYKTTSKHWWCRLGYSTMESSFGMLLLVAVRHTIHIELNLETHWLPEASKIHFDANISCAPKPTQQIQFKEQRRNNAKRNRKEKKDLETTSHVKHIFLKYSNRPP